MGITYYAPQKFCFAMTILWKFRPLFLPGRTS
jgi:hypothetical protein